MDNHVTILADGVADIPHIQLFDKVWAKRLSQIELDQLLVYVIDTVTPDALPYLAEQFDVAGEKGYALATTDAQKRAIIKRAIELKRYIGTVWAVREAMRSVGFGGATLQEGVDEGTPDVDWAKFRILVDLGNDQGLPDASGAVELTRLINYYKPARSLLVDISYEMNISDQLPDIDDEELFIGYEAPPFEDDLGWFARYADGTFTANGSIRAIEGNDSMEFTIQNV